MNKLEVNTIELELAELKPDWLNHCRAVGKLMQETAENKLNYDKNKCMQMYILGLLHEVGEEFYGDEKRCAKAGGTILKHLGFMYWEEIYNCGNPNTDFKSEELDLLNFANMMIDKSGNNVGIKGKLKELKEEFGEQSFEYKNSCKIIEILWSRCNLLD